jgi:hypothetical protein
MGALGRSSSLLGLLLFPFAVAACSDTTILEAAPSPGGRAPAGPAGEEPAPAACEPAPLACSPDGRRAEGCDDKGQKVVVDCADGETCRAGACVGPLDIERVTSAATKQLTEGAYAVAIVDTHLDSDTAVPFPLSVQGSVGPVPKTASLTGDVANDAPAHLCATLSRFDFHPPLANMQRPFDPPRTPMGIGERRTFNYPDRSSGGSSARVGVLRAVGQYANFWEDQTTGAPGSVVPDGAMQEIVKRYDQSVYPRLRQLFGDATDVDRNGKVDVFFTSLLPSSSAAAFVMPTVTLRPPGYYGGDWDFGEVVYSEGLQGSGPNAVGELMATLAHETQHLIYFGKRMAPYLASGQVEPDEVHADKYLYEGFAEFATLMAGQGYSGLVHSTLTRAVDHVSIARLFVEQPFTDPYDQVAGYGGGAIILQYAYDRAGGGLVTAGDRIEDRGGKTFVDQLTASRSGPSRLILKGKTADKWYVDFAGALLASTIPGRLPRDPAFTFAVTQKDPAYGGPVGALLDQKWTGQATSAPLLKRKAWAQKPAVMLGGGVGFYEFAVGQAPVTLKVTSPTAAVLVAKI